jgi:hypothetical protein
MRTRIWIEPVKRPDGRDWYTDRGLLLRTRLGGPHGEILCDRVHNAICETCRGLMSRGITEAFETWKEGILYPCMTGDIASTAQLEVPVPSHEPWRGGIHGPIKRLYRSPALCSNLIYQVSESSG